MPFLTLSEAFHTDERWKLRTSWRSHRPVAVLRSTYCATWLMLNWQPRLTYPALVVSVNPTESAAVTARDSVDRRRCGGNRPPSFHHCRTGPDPPLPSPPPPPGRDESSARRRGLRSWCDWAVVNCIIREEKTATIWAFCEEAAKVASLDNRQWTHHRRREPRWPPQLELMSYVREPGAFVRPQPPKPVWPLCLTPWVSLINSTGAVWKSGPTWSLRRGFCCKGRALRSPLPAPARPPASLPSRHPHILRGVCVPRALRSFFFFYRMTVYS